VVSSIPLFKGYIVGLLRALTGISQTENQWLLSSAVIQIAGKNFSDQHQAGPQIQ